MPGGNAERFELLGDLRRVNQTVGLPHPEAPAVLQVRLEGVVRGAVELVVPNLAQGLPGALKVAQAALHRLFEVI
ncbi:hypothetical protein DERA104750_15590 [Deinococcus radiodurans]